MVFLVLLFILTLAGGAIPLLLRKVSNHLMPLLLAFSGAFLLGITSLHLLPESFLELKEKTGLYILIGFFIQLLLQRLSHGIEHGHVHHHEGHQNTLLPILLGLGIHAFMEGIPLGFNYQHDSTAPSIFYGVAAHKLPEAFTLSSLLLVSLNSKRQQWLCLIVFAFISPLSGLMSVYYGGKFQHISSLLVYLIPVVIGSFIHISTTILYESGTRHHELSVQKIVAMIAGIGLSLATLLFE